MTCHDARERLSAYLDDALAPDERRDVAAHLEGCAECRRELARLDATVALLRRVEPARAPVGFVDRVVEAARPRPWYRRADSCSAGVRSNT
jgi:anti-sigma factor RsiW